MTDSARLSLASSLRRWFRENSVQNGFLPTLRRLSALLREFLRDSLPDRRRQRYGEADYDWDYRVDTTSATVGWRDRLLGLLHSPYQPTEPALFRWSSSTQSPMRADLDIGLIAHSFDKLMA